MIGAVADRIEGDFVEPLLADQPRFDRRRPP